MFIGTKICTMKIKVIYSIFLMLSVYICFLSQKNTILGKEDGAPTFCTGSPGDGGLTCAQTSCHTGNAVITQAGIITSDIPGTGYIPGSVYTFTVSLSKAGTTIFGFEVSPQTTNGTKVGTMSVTNPTETQLIGSSKFITHTISGITGSGGTKSWSFNWTAPVAGTGSVTFYGCINACNGDHTKLGDQVYKTTAVFTENTTGINAISIDKKVSIYPIPAKEFVNISTDFELNGEINISIYDVAGKQVSTKNYYTSNGNSIITIPVSHMNQGVYFMVISKDQTQLTKKMVIE